MAFARTRLGAVVAPKEIEFVTSLPKTRSGKIMRRLLKARELGLPEGDTSTLEGGKTMSTPMIGRTPSRTASMRSFCCAKCCSIRRFEEKAAELYTVGKIRGFLHLYIGEEAVAVGAMQAFAPDDDIVATYREHGHALARGMPAGSLMAEMFGKATGCSHGRGGSMHLFDVSRRFYGGNAIVGGGLPIAVGLALADKLQDRPARHGLLLWRRRGCRRRVPRIAESGRALEAACRSSCARTTSTPWVRRWRAIRHKPTSSLKAGCLRHAG